VFVAEPPEGDWPEPEETVVQPAAPPPPPPARLAFDEPAPARRWDGLGGWLLAALFLAAALIFLFLWLSQRDTASATVTVPELVGQREDAAQASAQGKGLSLTTVVRPSGEPAGTVIDQAPDAGAHLEHGARVMAVVSAGKGEITIPSLVGMQKDAAVAALKTSQLQAKVKEVESDKPAGTVVSQSPTAGENVARNSLVALVVAKGKSGGATTGNKVPVPSVVGMTEADAVTALQDAKLVPEVHQVAAEQPRGQVTGQNPASGDLVAPNSKVTINVSNGPTPTTQTRTVRETVTEGGARTVTRTQTVTRTETVTVTTTTTTPPP
jgi:serine/threonine-protein kinase